MNFFPEFIGRYRKEFDFYEQSCRMVAQILEANLRSAGVRAIVTSRAKSPARLEEKIRQRNAKANYKSVDDIYTDIVDLAGVRVALYFPGERDEVGKIIRSLFVLVDDPKEFPTSAKPTYSKRFSGYWATHYRVRMSDSTLNESQKRYSEAKVEIQVASVLMHAWSEVEHDLVYKPLQGALSEEEYAILDELNGLVLSGEIALERLQRAGELRASTRGREFTNHYDLAASLLDLARIHLSVGDVTQAAMGRVDVLFELMKAANLNTPDQLATYVRALHSDFEKRPLSEQIIDQILAEDSTRYTTYEQIRLSEAPATILDGNVLVSPENQAIGEFMSLWIKYEKTLRSLSEKAGIPSFAMPSSRLLSHLSAPNDVISVADRLRRFRNQLVHGIEVPDSEAIRAASNELLGILNFFSSPKLGSKRKPASKSIARTKTSKKKENEITH
ncbi:GTP pyrophosphokinase [Stenotrophomonas maltophilia]|uniref:GTP pyrophosphokinase n=1 Tax=Stenotrophomonas maltophilia TaxID=40324 RepID=UPI0013DBA121|nr:RelA/SpoT domain-containing protein [Stenotrophomonas maltophilia]